MTSIARSTATPHALHKFAKIAKLLAIFAALGTSAHLCAQTYTPIDTSGYNHDVIANGIGTAASTTSNDVDGAGFALKSLDWKLTETSDSQTSGLPADGAIVSGNNPNQTYQLQAYSDNNSLRLAESGVAGTLLLSNPSAYRELSILATSGSGSSIVLTVVHFSDGTQATFQDRFVDDWYRGSNQVVAGIGRVALENDDVEDNSTTPRLFPINIVLANGDQNKTVTKLDITRTGDGDDDGEGDGPSVLNIFALSGVDAIASANAVSVPSLGHLALALLSILAAGFGARGLRKRPNTLQN